MIRRFGCQDDSVQNLIIMNFRQIQQPSFFQQTGRLIDEQLNVELVLRGRLRLRLLDRLVRAFSQVDLRDRYLLILLVQRVLPEEDDSSVQHRPVTMPRGTLAHDRRHVLLVELEQESAVLDVYGFWQRGACRLETDGAF